jgi:hypothetical protein
MGVRKRNFLIILLKKKKLQKPCSAISSSLFICFLLVLVKISANHSVVYAPLTNKVHILHSFPLTEGQLQPSTIDPLNYLRKLYFFSLSIEIWNTSFEPTFFHCLQILVNRNRNFVFQNLKRITFGSSPIFFPIFFLIFLI